MIYEKVLLYECQAKKNASKNWHFLK